MFARVLMLIAILVVMASPSLAAITRIEQAVQSENNLKVYLAFEKDDGTSIQSVNIGEVNLSVNDQSLPVNDFKPFSQTGEGMAVTMLIDVSRTMGVKPEFGPDPFTLLVAAIGKMIDGMNEQDVFSIITFGDEVKVVQPFTNEKMSLRNALVAIKPQANRTHLYEGLQKAIEVNRQKGSKIPGRRGVIVISDGRDEGSGVGLDDVLKLNNASIPFFTVGYNHSGTDHLTKLRSLAIKTGGLYTSSSRSQDFDKTMQTIKAYLNSAYLANSSIPAGVAGKDIVLKAMLNRDNIESYATKQIQLIGTAIQEPMPDLQSVQPTADVPTLPADTWYIKAENFVRTNPAWVAGGTCLASVLLGVLIVVQRRKKLRRLAAAQLAADEARARDDDAYSSNALDSTLNWKDHAAGQGLAANITNDQNYAQSSSNITFSKAAAEKPTVIVGRLVVVSSQTTAARLGDVFPVSDHASLGRSDECSIHINDDKLSRRHADISFNAGIHTITDFRSTNGTFINGDKIQESTRLRQGDLIRAGLIEFRFEEAITG